VPPRSLRILLVRHGQSEANLDKSVNARLPDHMIELSPEGERQAVSCGKFLAQYLRSDAGRRRVRIFCSPYTRTRQTSKGIETGLQAAGIAFDKREAVELRELEFGLFDGIPDDELERQFPVEFSHYKKHKDFEGEFFAPMPLGESRCRVAERVKGIFGTILRDADPGRPDPVTDFIVVSHGVTVRCFRMQWMHYSWEWYEAEKNPQNCSIRLIEGVSGQGYTDIPLFEGFKSPRPSLQAQREEGTVGAAAAGHQPSQ
jgi:2,3-bisphosphoglycerate-dependent phosphoglycerate mutase